MLFFLPGIALATAILHLAGKGLGVFASRIDLPAVSRLSGSAIALSGVYLAFV